MSAWLREAWETFCFVLRGFTEPDFFGGLCAVAVLGIFGFVVLSMLYAWTGATA